MRSFIFLVLLSSSLLAYDEIVALYKGSKGNDMLHFNKAGRNFVCRAEGIETVSRLKKNRLAPKCQNLIETFEASFGDEPNIDSYLLKREQRYHIEQMGSECRIKISGVSYSKVLLKIGYARMRPRATFKNELWREEAHQAQLQAELEKKGLWSIPFLSSCFFKK